MFSWIWLVRLWFKEAIVGMFRNFWGNFTILGLTLVCLFLFSFAYVSGENLKQIAKSLDEKIEIRVDISDKVSESKYETIKEDILKLSQVKEVEYISKEQALKEMKEQMGEESDIIDVLDRNPFPARYIIRMKDPNDVKIVAKTVKSWNIADDVQYGKEYVEKLLKVTKAVRDIMYGFTIGILVVTLYMIGTFIKINIDRRKEEIEIKKLTGSGITTIRIPFILEAIIITLSASIIVYYSFVFGYDTIMKEVKNTIPYAPFIRAESFLNDIFGYLMIIGIGIGMMGSLFSTQKHLKRY